MGRVWQTMIKKMKAGLITALLFSFGVQITAQNDGIFIYHSTSNTEAFPPFIWEKYQPNNSPLIESETISEIEFTQKPIPGIQPGHPMATYTLPGLMVKLVK